MHLHVTSRKIKSLLSWKKKVIFWELCKKFKFDYAILWHMRKPESIQENEMHKIIWYFEILTDHLISARRPDLVIVNKKERTCQVVDFAVPADHRVKLKESEKRDNYLDLARELKKLWNMKVTVMPTVTGALGTETKKL